MQLLLDLSHRAADALVAGRQKAHQRQQQQAGIHARRAIGLDEAAALGVHALGADVVVNRVAPACANARCSRLSLGLRAAGAVERHPGHHLGMDEMLRRAADFPDAFIRLAPDLFQMRQEGLADLGPARRAAAGRPCAPGPSHRPVRHKYRAAAAVAAALPMRTGREFS